MRRPVDCLVISDVHLGTATCKAAELHAYLKSVDPGCVVLLGDIVDLWEFRPGTWGAAHTKVVRRLLKFAASGIPVYYVLGNHDEALQRFGQLALGDLQLCEELRLVLGGEAVHFIHGHQVDRRVGTSRWLARLGCLAYDTITAATDRLNRVRAWFGLDPVVDPTRRFKRTWAAGHISRFEHAIAGYAVDRGWDSVVCGHIHVPVQRTIQGVAYRNTGDWVDSLSALEWHAGRWSLVRYDELVERGLVVPPQALHDTIPVAVPA